MSWLDAIFKMTPLARFYASADQVENGDLSEMRCNDRGELLVSFDGIAAAWQDTLAAGSERVVKSTAGRLFQLAFYNTSASPVWIFIFDHPTAGGGRPANGGLPRFLPILIPPESQAGITLQRPRAFSTGLYWGASSTPGSFTYAAGATVMSSAEYT